MIAWFARNHVAANLLMLAIMVAGGWTLYQDKIPLEVFQDMPSRFISVNVPYPASSPEETEETIVLKIEEAIQQVGGIKHVNSTAGSSGGSVFIEVNEDDDPRRVMEDVKIRVDAIPNFPSLAEKPVIQLDDSFHSVITVILSADMAERDLKRLGEQTRDELASLPGISHADITGIRNEEIAIEISEDQLRKYGLTLESISKSIRDNAIDMPAGVVQTEAGDVSLRTRGRAYTGEDYARIPLVTRTDGSKVTLGEIAKILDGFTENPLITRLNGRRCVMISVMREGKQNAITIGERVKDYISEMNRKLPSGVRLDYWNDRSKIVKGRIDLLLQNAQSCLLLVFICVGLFLRMEAVIWVGVGMVMSFLGSIALMPYLDISINLSSLMGFILVLGIVVDDAIVISEHCDHLRTTEGLTPLEAAIAGTRRMAVPITFGVLTTVIAFLPMAIDSSDWGSMFKPIALIFITVMLIALMETKLILPSHLAHPFLGRAGDLLAPIHRTSDRALQWFVRTIYVPLIRLSVKNCYTVLALLFGGLAVIGGLYASGRISTTYFPRVPSERIDCRLTMLDGTPVEITEKHIERIYQIALEMQKEYVGPDGRSVVKHVVSTIGTTLSGRGSPSGTGSHVGGVTMETFGPEERSRDANTVEMANEWRQRIGNIVGAEELTFRAEIMRGGDPIDIQLTGTDPKELLGVSEKIKEKLSTYPALFDINDSLDSGRNEIQLKLKAEAQQFGITVTDLARQVRQSFYGDEVQRIQRGRNEVKVMLRMPKANRQNLATLDTMRVRTANGLEVPFSRVAEAKVVKSFTSIKRVDRRRALNISADADKGSVDIAALRAELTTFLDELLADSGHIRWSFEGEARYQRESQGRVFVSFMLVIAAMYGLMAIPFKSYTQPLIVLLVVPFGVVGAVIGHQFHNLPVSIMSFFGILGVCGVVVNDTLVLVDEINDLKAGGMPLREAVQRGGVLRFRAIFLTQITTFFGLVPLIFDGTWLARMVPFLFSNGAQSTHAQFLTPVSVAMGYGSLFATVITLFLVPLCYLAVDDIGQVLRRLWKGDEAKLPDSSTTSVPA
ncbi:efflux RND transporter permease subunit [Brevifollis gellanilyticus]|uniref:Acriflavin resistance protein n=1 Tax=Brevifollis gellanilyticus TaxID=748831 RepID=A0A512M7M5_9BACT|nr:efflux RND transporter permease subunit [Brevifollis gellanilyticus]GEP42724.1 acriflavin resistance protein [Brevifollis gellanilyticus]